VTASLVIDPVAKTATFTAPAAGRAYIFESKVNGGIGPNGKPLASYKTTFGIYTTTLAGRSVIAVNERLERNALFGYIVSLNDLIRNPTTFAASGTGFPHVTGGTLDGAV